MSSILSALRSWKTSILGALGFLTSLMTNVDKLEAGNNNDRVNVIMAALSILLLGIFAKDADKTGVAGRGE